jgi:thiamine biosynthesis lipoprotein
MKQTREIMGMPIVVDIADTHATNDDIEEIFKYFTYVDNTFSTYKEDSEISRFNAGKLKKEDLSDDVKKVFELCEETKQLTNGYFNILKSGVYDPSGLVKGWAIMNAAEMLKKKGFKHYYVEAGGDVQTSTEKHKQEWLIGIRNPFNPDEVVKVLAIRNEGVATSGTYIRGQHIYNPHLPGEKITEIVSLTIVGPNIYEADRYATAAFAMGKMGIKFVEDLPGCEGYMIDKDGVAIYTSGFTRYIHTK